MVVARGVKGRYHGLTVFFRCSVGVVGVVCVGSQARETAAKKDRARMLMSRNTLNLWRIVVSTTCGTTLTARGCWPWDGRRKRRFNKALRTPFNGTR